MLTVCDHGTLDSCSKFNIIKSNYHHLSTSEDSGNVNAVQSGKLA
jgi:hypothetical protein